MALGAILGGLVGLAGSAVPAALEVYNKKQERKHEVEMKKIEADLLREGKQFDIKLAEIGAETAETTGLYAHAAQAGEGWMGALQSSVRPVITYAFFGLFLAVKISALHQAWSVQNTPLDVALIAIWDTDTGALFAAILGFWFGSRSISKFGYGKK